jgi:lipopolysaccharide biosynthesis regulator YciM
MGKTSLSIFLVFLAVLGLFAFSNKDMVNVTVPFGDTYDMPKIALILICTSLGALAVLFVVFIRDTKRVIDNMQSHRKLKKDEKIREYYSKALNAILGDKEDDALGALNDILKEDPEHIDALLRLGDIALNNGDYKTSFEHYKKAWNIKPSNLQALFSLETVMDRTGRVDEALRYLDDILDLDPENLTALYRKRTFLEKKDRWDDLLSLQKIILKLEHSENDKNREEKKLLGYKYEYARAALENSEMEKAEKAFRTLLKMDPDFVPAYLGMTEVVLNKGETEETINLLEKGFEKLNSIIILARLEDLLISVGEPGRLIRFYKSALSRTPYDNNLKFLLGKLYFRLEMVDDAIETLNTVDAGMFSSPEIHHLKGELFMKRNQTARAVDEFRKAFDSNKMLKIPYCCSDCGNRSADWSGRCPRCLQWNTYRLDVSGTSCKA